MIYLRRRDRFSGRTISNSARTSFRRYIVGRGWPNIRNGALNDDYKWRVATLHLLILFECYDNRASFELAEINQFNCEFKTFLFFPQAKQIPPFSLFYYPSRERKKVEEVLRYRGASELRFPSMTSCGGQRVKSYFHRFALSRRATFSKTVESQQSFIAYSILTDKRPVCVGNKDIRF